MLQRIVLTTVGAVFTCLAMSTAQAATWLWPAIPFVRGADLCQFQDAYGQTRSVQAAELTERVRRLIEVGATASEAQQLLVAMETQLDQQRQLAARGIGMNTTLESTFRAQLDNLYRQRLPARRNVSFLNSQDLNDILLHLKVPSGDALIKPAYLGRLSGLAWGTYSYAPNCAGDLLVTLHVELKSGESSSFQGAGKPDQVMLSLAEQTFDYFQKMRFPYDILIGERKLTLLGGPGSAIGKAASPQAAERACNNMSARLPTAEEYDHLSCLGEWNGGLDLCKKDWALAGGKVFADDLRNPSPVRSTSEVNASEYAFICVR
jgi:hypothetical protein